MLPNIEADRWSQVLMCAAAALGVVDEIQVSLLTLMPLTLMPFSSWCMQGLMQSGANPNAADYDKRTALQ